MAATSRRGLVVTLAVNWLIKPFTMALLGVLFFDHVFAGLIAAGRCRSNTSRG